MKNQILTCKSSCPEFYEQRALIRWWENHATPYDSRLLMAVPNGGYRDPITASRLKATGVRAGVPDLFLAIPMNGHPGLWIEMKKAYGGALSKAQKNMILLLEKQGYAVCVAYGWRDAKDAILFYLDEVAPI